MPERREVPEVARRTREPAKARLALQILLQGPFQPRQLTTLLRERGIPRSTYYWVAERLGAKGGEVVGAVWTLMIQRRELDQQLQSVLQELAVLKGALGKPWRR